MENLLEYLINNSVAIVVLAYFIYRDNHDMKEIRKFLARMCGFFETKVERRKVIK